jgi:hypothetical protein
MNVAPFVETCSTATKVSRRISTILFLGDNNSSFSVCENDGGAEDIDPYVAEQAG